MNTYFQYTEKFGHSTDFFAVRDARNCKPENAVRVAATKKLRELAYLGCIPTMRVLENGKLGSL